jgi:hypothetical protein
MLPITRWLYFMSLSDKGEDLSVLDGGGIGPHCHFVLALVHKSCVADAEGMRACIFLAAFGCTPAWMCQVYAVCSPSWGVCHNTGCQTSPQ